MCFKSAMEHRRPFGLFLLVLGLFSILHEVVTISCGDPGFISNADRKGHFFSFPHSIKYVCHEGYRLVGFDTKFCSVSGTWQPTSISYCEEILCPVLAAPANGKVVPSNRRYGSTAYYECDRYYKLVGDSKQECLINGSWSGNSPVCEKITCKAPDKFPNGRMIGKKDTVYNASHILIFRCNDGATHSTSKCLENGEWSHPPPTCPDILVTQDVLTAHYNTDDILVTEEVQTAHYNTDDVLVTKDVQTAHYNTDDILVTEDVQTAHYNRDDILLTEDIQTAHYSTDDILVTEDVQTAHYTTDAVTISSGDPGFISNVDRKRLMFSFPHKITCKAPDKFPNGRILGKKDTGYIASHILTFLCNDGVTHSTSQCLENGEWSHPPPTCPANPFGGSYPFIDVSEAQNPIVNGTFILMCTVNVTLEFIDLFIDWDYPNKIGARSRILQMKPTYKFHFNRKDLFSEVFAHLIVTEAQSTDSGRYTCTVTDRWTGKTGTAKVDIFVHNPWNSEDLKTHHTTEDPWNSEDFKTHHTTEDPWNSEDFKSHHTTEDPWNSEDFKTHHTTQNPWNSEDFKTHHTTEDPWNSEDFKTQHTTQDPWNSEDFKTQHTTEDPWNSEDFKTHHTTEDPWNSEDFKTHHTTEDPWNSEDFKTHHTTEDPWNSEDFKTHHTTEDLWNSEDLLTHHSRENILVTEDVHTAHYNADNILVTDDVQTSHYTTDDTLVTEDVQTAHYNIDDTLVTEDVQTAHYNTDDPWNSEVFNTHHSTKDILVTEDAQTAHYNTDDILVTEDGQTAHFNTDDILVTEDVQTVHYNADDILVTEDVQTAHYNTDDILVTEDVQTAHYKKDDTTVFEDDRIPHYTDSVHVNLLFRLFGNKKDTSELEDVRTAHYTDETVNNQSRRVRRNHETVAFEDVQTAHYTDAKGHAQVGLSVGEIFAIVAGVSVCILLLGTALLYWKRRGQISRGHAHRRPNEGVSFENAI